MTEEIENEVESPIGKATQSLTLGEIAIVENMSGQSIKALASDDAPMGKSLIGLAYVIGKKTRPNWTLSDAENVTMDEFTKLVDGDGDDAPKAPASEPVSPSPWDQSAHGSDLTD